MIKLVLFGYGPVVRHLIYSSIGSFEEIILVTNQKVDLEDTTSMRVMTRSDFLQMNEVSGIFVNSIRRLDPDNKSFLNSVIHQIFEVDPLVKLINLSSFSIYGSNLSSRTEYAAPNPFGMYGKQKLQMEDFLSLQTRLNNVMNLRISNLYCCEDLPGVVSRIIQSEGSVEPLKLQLNVLRNFVSLEDLARFLKILSQPSITEIGGHFNFSSNKSQSLKDLVQAINAVRNMSANVTFEPFKEGLQYSILDNAKVKACFDFEFSTFADTLKNH